ncbi:MAG: exo-alpha-sialidase, partial [Chlorobi bacterium]|nr:exo-alpha-sialidase [Chlorobiota bacterium]
MKIHPNYSRLLFLFAVVSFISASFISLEAEEVKKAAFRRLTESAHPIPQIDLPKSGTAMIPLANEVYNPLFLNSNCIVPETEKSKMQNESSIAVNPLNSLNLIASAVDYRDNSSSWVYVSHDGGKTWDNINLGKPPELPHWKSSNDPSVAFGPDGTGYLVFGAFPRSDTGSTGENAVMISKTTDEGRTWYKTHIPVIIHQGSDIEHEYFEDKYYISVDNALGSPHRGNLYIPWKRVTPRDSATQIVISHSTDRGDTWTEPINVSLRLPGSSEDTTFGQSFPLAAVGAEGEVYVVWNHGIEHGVGFAKSVDGANSFGDPRIIHNYNIFGTTTNLGSKAIPIWRHAVKNVVRAEAYPVIVCDTTAGERRGNVYVCWAADKTPNIYFSRSEDGGDDWSEPIIVNSDTTGDQFWAWMSIDPANGDLAIMYLDSRNDPANLMSECYVSYSADGGATWTDRRAAEINSDLRRNPFGSNFAGDYSGMAFYHGMIYPSWVDMRSAVKDIYDSDVYTAIINTKAPEVVTNFYARTIPEEKNTVKLTWTKPSGRAFGQTLADDDFVYYLCRDSVMIAEIPGGTTSYDDTELMPYEVYHYDITAVAGIDSSLPVSDSAFAGGSRNPGSVTLTDAEGNEDISVNINLKLPALREDMATPLVNLKKLMVWRDDAFYEEIELTPADTGKDYEYIDNPEELGYYQYSFAVGDDNDPANVGPRTENVLLFAGSAVGEINENFDNDILPRYYLSGSWGIASSFFLSPGNSITDTPDGDYVSKTETEFRLLPVKIIVTTGYTLSFAHAAIVANNDKAYVEISSDMGESWVRLETFNSSDYDEWKDGELSSADWKTEYFQVDRDIYGDAKNFVVRFRLKTGTLTNNDGWYIDNLLVSMNASVDEDDKLQTKLTA